MQIESDNYVLEDPQFGTNSNPVVDNSDQTTATTATVANAITPTEQPKRIQTSWINALLGSVIVILFIIWFYIRKSRSN